ncbi:hypothetical protein Ancab_032339 [Ancistrocladus abbreviatus]
MADEGFALLDTSLVDPLTFGQEGQEHVESGAVTESQCTFFGSIMNKPKRGEDYTILQMVFSIDMVIIFITTLCGLGSSYTAVDNLGQIGDSLGSSTTTISSYVALVSIWNYFGRVFAGFVSESLLLKHKIPRPLMMSDDTSACASQHWLPSHCFPKSRVSLCSINDHRLLFCRAIVVPVCYNLRVLRPQVLLDIVQLRTIV